MIYRYRGYNPKLKEWIFGNGMYCIHSDAGILNTSGEWKCAVNPETIGRRYVLNDSTSTEVYQGDVICYTFDHAKELYHRYYVIKETENGCWAEELWRDYEMDCNTFEVTRFHNVRYAGTRKNLDTFDLYKPVKVIGNIWQNPELL